MDWITLKAAEWLPDQPDLNNPGATIALNCYAGATSYLPLPDYEEFSEATPGTGDDDYVRGVVSAKDGAGSTHVFAGDAVNLYELSATYGWATIATGYSSVASTNVWNFCQWSPEIIVATNYNNEPQKIVPSSGTVSVLGGNPPRAKYCAQVKDFLFLGYLHDGVEELPNFVQWSGFNNVEYWSSGLDMTRQADRQELFEGGAVQGIINNHDRALVIQEQAVQLFTYTGQSRIFQRDRVESALGASTAESIISYRDRAYWWGTSDIWMFQDHTAIPIAGERIARHLFDGLDNGNTHRVSAIVDPTRNIIMWAYPGPNNVDGRPNKVLIYSWNASQGGRWSEADIMVNQLVTFETPGVSWDALPGLLDDLTPPPDDDFWKGGERQVGMISANNKLSTFSGAPLSAQIESGEDRMPDGRFLEIVNTRPLFEGNATPKIFLGTRNLQDENVSWKEASAYNRSGECNIRSNARFTRARLQLSGNWTHAIGVDVYGRQAGNR